MIIFLLLEEGFPGENIKKEDFNPGNKKLAHRAPPDKNTYQVTIEINGAVFSFLYNIPIAFCRLQRN